MMGLFEKLTRADKFSYKLRVNKGTGVFSLTMVHEIPDSFVTSAFTKALRKLNKGVVVAADAAIASVDEFEVDKDYISERKYKVFLKAVCDSERKKGVSVRFELWKVGRVVWRREGLSWRVTTELSGVGVILK